MATARHTQRKLNQDADRPPTPPTSTRAAEARTQAELTGQFIYLEVGPQVWGKGFTRDDAHRNAGRPRQYLVYACTDPWARITPMGDIEYTYGTTYWEVTRHPKTVK